jgi:hypothetical protein
MLTAQVTQVDPAIDEKEEGYQPRNENDAYNYRLCKFRVLPELLQRWLENSSS